MKTTAVKLEKPVNTPATYAHDLREHLYEQPIHLSDETKIGNTTWSMLKEFAMKDNVQN